MKQVIDYAERGLLLLFFVAFAVNVVPSIPLQPWNAVYLVAQSLQILFVLFRRQGEVSLRPVDWLVAIAGSSLPLVAEPGGAALVHGYVGGAFMVMGVLLHMTAKFSLRRSFGMVAANRGVMVGGVYRYVRNPMYAGYALEWIGFFLLNASWYNAALFTACLALNIGRILAEEKILFLDPAYRAYASRVRYRLLPLAF